MTDTANLHRHGQITVLLFLLIIKNCFIHDVTYSEVGKSIASLICKYGGKAPSGRSTYGVVT